MDARRVADAMKRYVLGTSEQVERQWDHPDAVTVKTARAFYEARPASWRIAAQPWVTEAVTVLADTGVSESSPAYGLLVTVDGEVVDLTDVDAVSALGARIGTDLDPLAYAEILAELHYRDPETGSTRARPQRPGEMMWDADTFTQRFPAVDPDLAAAPVVRTAGGTTIVVFRSFVRYFTVNYGTALDVFEWTVTAPHGSPATWVRRTVAERVALPWEA